MAKRHKGAKQYSNSIVDQVTEEGADYSAPIISEDMEEQAAQDPRVQLVQADFDRQAALEAAGEEDQVYGFWGKVYKVYNWYHAKTHGFRFKKKTYMWLMLFTGWAGGHRWYQGRRLLGAFMTLLCWTGLPLVLCVQDFMEVYPIKEDENGYIVM